MAQSNAERQRAFRERRKASGQGVTFSALVTEDEAFYLQRVLAAMRQTGGTPSALRDPKTGRFVHLDA